MLHKFEFNLMFKKFSYSYFVIEVYFHFFLFTLKEELITPFQTLRDVLGLELTVWVHLDQIVTATLIMMGMVMAPM